MSQRRSLLFGAAAALLAGAPAVASAQAIGAADPRVAIWQPPAAAHPPAAQGPHRIDPLALGLHSQVALVIDQDTQDVLLARRPEAVVPIASLTKLMTALVVLESRVPLAEVLEVTQDDIDTVRGSSSRLPLGVRMERQALLQLALMSSENRAAHALARQHPGGLEGFIGAMNARARRLGMRDTRFVDPTGLGAGNLSSAWDLALLTSAAAAQPLIRQWSTAEGADLLHGQRMVPYRNTNRFVTDPGWGIALQKTGYTSDAGRCLVMQARLAGRRLLMVLLGGPSGQARTDDAQRIRRWVEAAAAGWRG